MIKDVLCGRLFFAAIASLFIGIRKLKDHTPFSFSKPKIGVKNGYTGKNRKNN